MAMFAMKKIVRNSYYIQFVDITTLERYHTFRDGESDCILITRLEARDTRNHSINCQVSGLVEGCYESIIAYLLSPSFASYPRREQTKH